MEIKDSDRYFTPTWILDKVAEQWPDGIDLDPCYDPDSYVKAANTYDIRQGQDGLLMPWKGRIFINPPYSKPAPWATRAVQHVLAGSKNEALVLVNSTTGAAWWSDYVFPYAAVCFIKGRLRFGRPGGTAVGPNTYDSALLHYGRDHGRFLEVWSGSGKVVQPVLAKAA